MIRDIQEEICEAIEELYDAAYKANYIAYILLIGRAEMQHGLKAVCGTDCVMEWQMDIYYDETRAQYYLDYLRRNYSRDGYSYQGDGAINDITTEMTIYAHLWDSEYFMKSLYRFATIIDGNGYLWEDVLPERRIHEHFCENVIRPFKEHGLKLGNILERVYKSSIRNAFAHSRYTIDVERREIQIRPNTGYEKFSFDEFQDIFLHSVILMNKMENYQEMNHNSAAEKNAVLTEAFMTPDDVLVQVKGIIQKRGDISRPEFRIVKVIDN